MVSTFLKKEQFSRPMNELWVVQLQKQQDAGWFFGLIYDILKMQ